MSLQEEGYYCKNSEPFVFVYEEDDLIKALKELKEEFKGQIHFEGYKLRETIDKIFGRRLTGETSNG